VGSVTGAVGSVTGTVGSVGAGGITAASFAANAITAAKIDPDVTTELQAGLATAVAVADLPTNAELTTALAGADDAVLAAVADVQSDVDGISTLLAGTDSDVEDIKAKTDSLTFTVANVLDANTKRINGTVVNGDGAGTPWGP